MADSTTPKLKATDKALLAAPLPASLSLHHFNPPLPLVVALSGGADSTAMLLACVKQWPGKVKAIHVHHGLQAAADAFAQHCQQLCDQLQVPLVIERIDARHAPGESPEESARRGRYQAMASVFKMAPHSFSGSFSESYHLVFVGVVAATLPGSRMWDRS